MSLLAATLASAFLLDYFLGDPVYALHPVRLIGLLIGGVERILRRIGLSGVLGGLLLMVLVTAVSVAVYAAIRIGLAHRIGWYVLAFDIFVVYSCFALKDMVKHALPIAKAVDQKNTAKARELIQKIVGRDASVLDLTQIARAAVESVAESFVDGFLAPVFWFLICGLIGLRFGNPLPYAVSGIVMYRCINTLDSMVGYRNEKYQEFGRISARADDVLNFVPARLCLALFVPASLICSMDARKGLRTAARDRLKHASPNAAHAESFIAGALDLRLGGPTQYPHGTVVKPWIGSGTDQAQSVHIRRACGIVMAAGCLFTAVVLVAGYIWQ